MLNALFEYTFLQNAFWAAILTGIICGIIGTYVVINRLVFLSGGITHASFGGIGIAWYLGINPILGATLFSIFSALGMEYLTQKGNFRSDTIIGMLWTVGMAIGILFIYITPGYTPNLMSYLFGSILSVERLDLYLLVALSVITVLTFFIFYRPIQFISFDKEYAKTHRMNLGIFQNFMIVLITLTIVLSIKIVGIILVMSLLTLPQAIASLLSKKYLSLLYLSVLFAILGTIIGLAISWYLNIPSGAT
ncbi:MAG TPA: metal ABC transporter permease, partial [Salinivirgaceae bacterium]|nr:metal ABC transporter permease [Salinivirgaceae bacterium]